MLRRKSNSGVVDSCRPNSASTDADSTSATAYFIGSPIISFCTRKETTILNFSQHFLSLSYLSTTPKNFKNKMLLSNSVRFLLITSLFVSGSDALGCKGGDTFNGGGDGCNLNSVSCTEETCVKDMGGLWTADCPDPAADCDPLAPSDVDPSCTGQPESIDRGGKKMYRRKIISSEKPQDSEEGVFCHVTLELCDGETSLTQGVDSGFGDYYRLGATAEWCDYKGTDEFSYDGMSECESARSYSHVNPLNENTVQFIIKKETGDPVKYDCTEGVDCKFGMSELMCFAPVGSEILVSVNPDHAGVDTSTHYAYRPVSKYLYITFLNLNITAKVFRAKSFYPRTNNCRQSLLPCLFSSLFSNRNDPYKLRRTTELQ